MAENDLVARISILARFVYDGVRSSFSTQLCFSFRSHRFYLCVAFQGRVYERIFLEGKFRIIFVGHVHCASVLHTNVMNAPSSIASLYN